MALVRLQVGPLPSTSVLSWITYARETIDALDSDPFESDLPADIRTTFVAYLTQWLAIAEAGDVFVWDAEVPSEVVEYQVHAFHQVANRLAQAAIDRGEPQQPADGAVFYQALVNGIIDGLQMEGASAAEYAMHLRSFWPGLGDSAAEAADETDGTA